MRTGIRFLSLGILIAMLVAGCASPAASSAPQNSAAQSSSGDLPAGETYKIGGMFAITGPASSLGVPERDTLAMLADEINKKGGINGHKIELFVYDNRGDETESVKVAKKLIDEHNVLAIIGPSRTGDTLAIIDTIEKAEVPMISLAASIQIVEPTRKWVFKTTSTDRLEVAEVLSYLKAKNITKVAMVHETSAWGTSGRDTFDKLAPAAGIQVVAKESYGDRDPDVTAQLTRVKGTDAEAIIAWGTSQSSATVAKNGKQLGIAIPIIHSSGIANLTFLDLAGAAAEGTIFASAKLPAADLLPDSDPQKPVLLAYAKAFKERYGKEADLFGGVAWDATNIVFQALEKSGADRAKLRDEIEKIEGFVGATGIFRYSATDHNGLSKDAMVLLEVKDGKWSVLKY